MHLSFYRLCVALYRSLLVVGVGSMKHLPRLSFFPILDYLYRRTVLYICTVLGPGRGFCRSSRRWSCL